MVVNLYNGKSGKVLQEYLFPLIEEQINGLSELALNQIAGVQSPSRSALPPIVACRIFDQSCTISVGMIRKDTFHPRGKISFSSMTLFFFRYSGPFEEEIKMICVLNNFLNLHCVSLFKKLIVTKL